MTDSTGPEQLLARLDDIGAALLRSGHALALIGLGSVGLERHRLDRYSDLDFFVIVEPGHKALSTDGVYCEFAVFEPGELATIPYAPGRIVWRRPDVDESIAIPARPLPAAHPPDAAWIVGEALSCLYVGLQRWLRGEKLSAARLVQGHALDRLIEFDAMRPRKPPRLPA
jgi:hypothetical protein